VKNRIKVNITNPSKESEAGRLLFTAYKIATRQYQHHSFLPLPTLPPNPPNQAVYFPNLPYQKINDFWPRVTHSVKPDTPVVAPSILVKELSQILPDPSPPKYEYSDHAIFLFLDDCTMVIPELLKNLKKINIILTNYGTTKSFSLITPKNHTLNLYLRQDQPIDTLLEGIISGISRDYFQKHYHYTWEETEVAKDTLLTTTILKHHLPNYHSLLMQTRVTPDAKLQKLSTQYLNSLGFGPNTSWRISSSEIYYNQILIKNLTKKEQAALTLLINNYPSPVSAELLGEALYPNPDTYSPWGVSKTIQRLRDKLTLNNLSPHLISSARNHGYLLNSQQLPLPDRDF